MIKKYTLILLIFTCYFGYGQYEWTPGKIVLKNGISFRGLVKIPIQTVGIVPMGSNKVQYKKNRKSNKIKYGSDDVNEIIFGDEQFATVHYQYVAVNKNKSILMEVVVKGTVNLYTRTVSQYNNTFIGNQNLPTSTSIDYNSQYYLKREKEQTATLIAGQNSFGSFIYKAKEYFSDCNDIISYLDNDLYHENNLIDLVEDYNLLCE